MHKVPFLSLAESHKIIEQSLIPEITASFRGGYYIGGPDVARFENEFATFVGAEACVGVGNGLDALKIALKALGIGPGDEVIVPNFTFIATWLAVLDVGAIPVTVPVGVKDYLIDAEKIEAHLTKKTKAIIPVHLYGQAADMSRITSIAKEHKLFVIEDAAQAHGASQSGRRIGSHSDAVAWSFYPGKNLGGYGDGGAVTTNNKELASKIRAIANYGSETKYVNVYQGYNSRLDPVQSVVLSHKLKYLESWNARRMQIAEIYLHSLAKIPSIQEPTVNLDNLHVWHLFVIQVSNRDSVAARMLELGIECSIHYPISNFSQKCFEETEILGEGQEQAFKIASRVLSLPIDPTMTDEQAHYVIKNLISVNKEINT
jgi:dTDP-4-amino-4,6-dideoxygalactose transaminase